MAKKQLNDRSSLVMGAGISAPVSTSVNEGFDRRMTVIGRTTEGVSESVSSFVIVQLGLREEFIPKNETEGLECSDGEVFGVLK